MPNVLDVTQAAAALGVHPETVRRWLREKRLRGTRLSVQAGWRIPITEVERLLSEPDPADPDIAAPTPAERPAANRGQQSHD